MLTVYSQILVNVQVPMIVWRKTGGVQIVWCSLFKLFPVRFRIQKQILQTPRDVLVKKWSCSQVLLTIAIMWAICGILTITDTLPIGHPARTDVKIKILSNAPWFRVPYPGQWGVPTVSFAGVLGMLAGVIACTVESISYYPTTSRMCGTNCTEETYISTRISSFIHKIINKI